MRIKWNAYGDPKANKQLSRPVDGVLCRWLIHDMLEGLIEIEAKSVACGTPEGEWTEQFIRAYRVIEEYTPKMKKQLCKSCGLIWTGFLKEGMFICSNCGYDMDKVMEEVK